MARTNKRQLSAKPKSPFQHAVENTSEISSAYCKGLQALKKSETGKVIASEPIKIDGSVDIDSAVNYIRKITVGIMQLVMMEKYVILKYTLPILPRLQQLKQSFLG